MKTKYIYLLLGVWLGFSLSAMAADAPSRTGKLNHVVAFKFKETATPAQVGQVEGAFRDLKKKIKEIRSYEWGINVSPEKHDKGFTHGFILTFRSEQDRNAYLVHPDHQAFGKMLGPILGDVFVIDFWSEK